MAYHNWPALFDTEAEADEHITKFRARYPSCYGARATKQSVTTIEGVQMWRVDFSHWDCE